MGHLGGTRLQGMQWLMVGLSSKGGCLVLQCLIGVVFFVMGWVLITCDGETLVEIVESGDALVYIVGIVADIVQGRQGPVLPLCQPTHKPILLSLQPITTHYSSNCLSVII